MADQPAKAKPNKSKSGKPSSTDTKKRKLNDGELEQIREVFENVYVVNKWRIIRINFLRGIAFGLGTFIGGTIVVAIVVWFLSQTVDVFPWATDFTQQLIDSLQK